MGMLCVMGNNTTVEAKFVQSGLLQFRLKIQIKSATAALPLPHLPVQTQIRLLYHNLGG